MEYGIGDLLESVYTFRTFGLHQADRLIVTMVAMLYGACRRPAKMIFGAARICPALYLACIALVQSISQITNKSDPAEWG